MIPKQKQKQKNEKRKTKKKKKFGHIPQRQAQANSTLLRERFSFHTF